MQTISSTTKYNYYYYRILMTLGLYPLVNSPLLGAYLQIKLDLGDIFIGTSLQNICSNFAGQAMEVDKML